jgi:hypothetical protein
MYLHESGKDIIIDIFDYMLLILLYRKSNHLSKYSYLLFKVISGFIFK